jgi:hypothetical protein
LTIATGIVEDTCRHVIADQLAGRAGAWPEPKPSPLRAVISNGDFDEHWRFHPAREHQRLYPGTTQGQHALAA